MLFRDMPARVPESVRAGILLVAILQTCFWPFVWGNKTLLASARIAPSVLPGGAAVGPSSHPKYPELVDPGGAAWQIEPWLAFVGNEYRHGKLPLWNPYQAFGTPLAANMQSQPFYPLTALLSLYPTPKTYNFYILARLFIAGLSCYAFLRLFVDFSAALTGGIIMMLAGYFVLSVSMPYLSVETSSPLMLFTCELLLRRPTFVRALYVVSAIVLVLLGGMPESALLLFTFAAGYVLFRILFDRELRMHAARLVLLNILALSCGVLLASFFILPFVEYLLRSSNPHSDGAVTGSYYTHLNLSLLVYMFPLLFGPLFSSPAFNFFEVRSYLGIVVFVPVLIAVFGVLRRTSLQDRSHRSTAFFSVCALLMFLKNHGAPGIQWVGSLPLYQLVNFPKYSQPLLVLCIAVLCAFGIERVRRREAGIGLQALAILILLGVTAFARNLSRSTVVAEIRQTHLPRSFSHLALILPCALLAIALLCVLATLYRQVTRRVRLDFVLCGIITAELSFNYIVPMYWFYNNEQASSEADPYAGAAFVRFLQQNTPERQRVFGRDWLLMPSWASVFQLFDIRDMDGLYYERYFPFLRVFSPIRASEAPELVSSMLGNGSYDFRQPINKRLLQLSSVKYLITRRLYGDPNRRIEELLDQQGSSGPFAQQVEEADFVMDGQQREAILMRNPVTRLPYRLEVKPGQTAFHLSYGMSPGVFDIPYGNGAAFTIEARDESGSISRLFSTYIDPKHNKLERHWFDADIDLSRYEGQKIEILLSTDPGPKGDSSFDWTAWSDFRFRGEQSQRSELRPVYEGEARIYEYDNVLPRAAVYFAADLAHDDAAVRERLADSSLNVFQRVVLNARDLTHAEAATVAAFNRRPMQPVAAARMKRYTPQAVEVETNANSDGIFVLNDTNYPGWIASVDGRIVHLFTANYLFRAVLLPRGSHIVTFEYRPTSFYAGAWVSSLTAILLAAYWLLRRSRSL